MSARERGRLIVAETRELALALKQGRERYWLALLARPQMAGQLVHAIKEDLDSQAWSLKLARLAWFGREMARTRRAAERHRYRRACARAAVWLAGVDLKRAAAEACEVGIGLWAGRQVPEGHRWADPGIHTARTRSRAWKRYWGEIQAARQACLAARNRIVDSNEGLVISAIRKWAPWAVGHLQEDDLQQSGREGLMTAADRWDPVREPPVAFSTYSMWWIRHVAWRSHQQLHSDIRAPIAVQALAQKLAGLVAEHPGAGPEDVLELWNAELDEKARESGGKRAKSPTLAATAQAMVYMGHRGVSFDQPMGPAGDERTLADVMADPQAPIDEQLDHEQIIARLLRGLERLPEAERRILTARYGIDGPERSARELNREGLGTMVEIDQVEERALERLREQLTG